jgi:hypothetical protein
VEKELEIILKSRVKRVMREKSIIEEKFRSNILIIRIPETGKETNRKR